MACAAGTKELMFCYVNNKYVRSKIIEDLIIKYFWKIEKQLDHCRNNILHANCARYPCYILFFLCQKIMFNFCTNQRKQLLTLVTGL
eukprot:UN23576